MIQPNLARSSVIEDAQTPFESFRDKNMRDELKRALEVLDDAKRKIIFDAIRVGRRQTENPRGSW